MRTITGRTFRTTWGVVRAGPHPPRRQYAAVRRGWCGQAILDGVGCSIARADWPCRFGTVDPGTGDGSGTNHQAFVSVGRLATRLGPAGGAGGGPGWLHGQVRRMGFGAWYSVERRLVVLSKWQGLARLSCCCRGWEETDSGAGAESSQAFERPILWVEWGDCCVADLSGPPPPMRLRCDTCRDRRVAWWRTTKADSKWRTRDAQASWWPGD